MAKQLNSNTGKGWFVEQGQSSVEFLLSSGTTQKQLAEMAGLFTGEPRRPNAGAVSNILKGLGWGPFNGQLPVVTAKTVAKPTKPAATPATPAKPAEPVAVPGRVSDFFEDNVEGYVVGTEITPEMVEKVILDDSVKWNQRIMKFGPKEIESLAEFLGSGGFCPVARVSMRGEWYADQKRMADQKRIAEAIAAISAIDARLSNQRERFEAARYDADITAFYAE